MTLWLGSLLFATGAGAAIAAIASPPSPVDHDPRVVPDGVSQPQPL